MNDDKIESLERRIAALEAEHHLAESLVRFLTGKVEGLAKRFDSEKLITSAHIERTMTMVERVEGLAAQFGSEKLIAAAHIERMSARLVGLETGLQETLDGFKAFAASTDEHLQRYVEVTNGQLAAIEQLWRGTTERIDRQTGTLADLLKRFEAWKVTGNELAQDVRAASTQLMVQEDRLDAQKEHLGQHDERLERHAEMLATALNVIKAIKELLTEFRHAVTGEERPEPGSADGPVPAGNDHALDPGAWAPGRSGEGGDGGHGRHAGDVAQPVSWVADGDAAAVVPEGADGQGDGGKSEGQEQADDGAERKP